MRPSQPLDDLDGLGDTVFGPDRLAQGARTITQGTVNSGGLDGLGQPLRCEPHARDRCWAHARTVNTATPQELVASERHEDRRHTGAKPCTSRTRAPVVDHRRHPREEPVVRRSGDGENIPRG